MFAYDMDLAEWIQIGTDLDRCSAGVDFGINNIFDESYAQSVLINAVGFGGAEPRYFYPGNDRNFYGGLRLRYEF